MLGQFLPEQIVLEGKKVINYRVFDCPTCAKSQIIENKIVLGMNRDIITVRCPWCNELSSWSIYPNIGQQLQFYVKEVD